MRRDDWLKNELKDWAVWIESINSYSSSTSEARAMAGILSGEGFASSLPKGAEPPQRYLQKLVHAMGNCLSSPRKAKYIECVQITYLYSRKIAGQYYDRPESTVRRWANRGEDILRRELQGNG